MTGISLSQSDPNSYSNPDEAVVKNLHISLNVDFDKHVLSGFVDLEIRKKNEAVNQIILDTSLIKLQSVINLLDNSQLSFVLDSEDEKFGSKLTVDLPKTNDLDLKIRINYETNARASALQWLEPDQTAGGKHPYMFSQCQPIHCRSIIPCQDTPGVKMPYSAEISAPSDLTVVMSALKQGSPVVSANGTKKYTFKQDVPMPSYLIAIAVGNLTSKPLGPRSNVWAEPEFVEAAAFEFSETEKMIATAEELCGEYVWGLYDVLLMPPSFPYGGMENPCLTFVTPTLLAGDRSLACVVAHEISHSWTGNLVTNRNFEHFWLNEGFTMFLERKILGRMQGEAARQFAALNGLNDLRECFKVLKEDNVLTKLVVDLKGIHPGEAFSSCPYEKGFSFLFYLEQLVGGPESFEPFLKKYLNHFKYKSIDTDDFKNFFLEYFSENEAVKSIEWTKWLDTCGMPYKIPSYDKSLAEACDKFASDWINWDCCGEPTFTADDLTKFTPPQREQFLSQLLLADSFPTRKVQAMQKLYNLNSVNNCEIKFRWLRLCLKAKWTDAVPLVKDFVTKYGRMKYVRPLYRDLYGWEEMRQEAIDTFEKNKHKMMHVSAAMVANDLKLPLES
ncbi:hypothetical protein LSTR_LSTR009632 [Laodelphax striatellus]|uniref:Leukotriene A(4) hydrolase n=1 Tax=Laodelphax striatellus TaxID=195883 RepID=A0A482WPU4_LAOST|nr:hypothetical protein LSTR_LSTR009632 [Laodelphax striatellus]